MVKEVTSLLNGVDDIPSKYVPVQKTEPSPIISIVNCVSVPLQMIASPLITAAGRSNILTVAMPLKSLLSQYFPLKLSI